MTTRKYQPIFWNSFAMSFMPSNWPATRKQTPAGAKRMIHDVIFIITKLTLWKNRSSGLPCSPVFAMTMPVTTEKTTKPS